jgi:hypothetical protein
LGLDIDKLYYAAKMGRQIDNNDEEQGLGLKTNNGKTTTRRSMVPLSGLLGHTGLYDATHRQPARVGKKPVADDIGVADFC